MVPQREISPARWLVESYQRALEPGIRRLVPAGFEATLRVFHPFTSGDDLVSWGQVATSTGVELEWNTSSATLRAQRLIPPARSLDLSQVQALLPILRDTMELTPDPSIYVGAWVGEGIYDQLHSFPTYRAPRDCVLFRGPLSDVATEVARDAQWRGDGAPPVRPYQWWPANRRWYVISDIDLDSTLVAADRDLLARLANAVESRFLSDISDPDLSPLGG